MLKLNRAITLILICFSIMLNSSCKRRKATEKEPIIPPGYEVHGIDVSHYQNHIDWEIVGRQKTIKFVFINYTVYKGSISFINI